MGKRKTPRHKTRFHKARLREDNLDRRIAEETRPVRVRKMSAEQIEVLRSSQQLIHPGDAQSH